MNTLPASASAGRIGTIGSSRSWSRSQALAGSIDSVKLPTTFLRNASAIHGEGSLGEHGRSCRSASELLDATGAVAVSNGTPLRFTAGPDTVDATVRSPVFSPFQYNSGIGQFTDQMMRTQFWSQFPHRGWGDAYHDVLIPQGARARTIQIPFGSWYFFVNAAGQPQATVVDIDRVREPTVPAGARR